MLALLPAAASAEPYRLAIGSELGRRLSNLPENSWVRLNLNEFQDVWTPLDQRPRPPEAPSSGGPYSILDAWSSMAWDSNRGSLIIWGGGHANYPGNEIYRWNADQLLWERASLPSQVVLTSPGGALFEAIDGPFNAPIAAHTYDSSEFLPISDRFVTFGGAAFNTGHYFELSDGRRSGPYFWDPSRANANSVGGTQGSQVKPDLYPLVSGGRMWQNRSNLHPSYPGELKPGWGGTYWIYGNTAYTEENGKDVLYLQASSELYRYTVHDVANPALDTYERVGRYSQYPFSGQGAGALDPERKIYLRTANTTFTYWTLQNPGSNNQNTIFSPMVSSGSFPLSDLKNHGLDFDPMRKSFLLWGGQREVWQLTAPANLAGGQWTLAPLNPASTAAPNLAAAVGTKTGILGKWKYVAALDVFLGIIDKNKGEVWAYKPANWRPKVHEALPYVVTPATGSVHAAGSGIPVRVDSVDKTVTYVAVYANGSAIGTATAVPYAFVWNGAANGNHTLTVRTVGTDGVERVSPPVNISVGAAGNIAPTVTLTAPGAGQSFAQGGVIGVQATAADSDGAVARVEFYANGVKLGEDTTAPYSLAWSGAAVGSHTLTAVAVDDGGASKTSAAVGITVTSGAANQPPTVALTAPAAGQSYAQGAVVTLQATAADSDGTVARVEFYANGVKLGEDLNAPYTYSWGAAGLGSHTLTAVAVDNGGASKTSAAVGINVVAGGSGNETMVTLQDGVAGYAGTTETYVYEYHANNNFGTDQYLQDKATGTRIRSLVRFAIFQSEGGPVPDGAAIVSASLNLYKYGYYDTKYQLKPMLVEWSETAATWNQRTAGAPWAVAGALGQGSDAAAAADAQADAGWDPGWVVFDITGGVQAIAAGSRSNLGWVLDTLSGNGNVKRFYSSEYAANPALRPKLVLRYVANGSSNIAPTVTLTAPGAGQSFAQGGVIGVQATAADSDGAVARVEFYANGVKLGEDTTAPYSLAWSGAAVGSHTLTAVAVDDGGASKTSAAVGITVTSGAANQPPTVALTAPAAGQSYAQGAVVTLQATAADSDGTVARVEFYANGVKLGEDLNAPYTYSWGAAGLGSHTLTAVAVDNGGASKTSAAVGINVVAGGSGNETMVTLQDGVAGYAGTTETYVYEYHANNNFGTDQYLQDKATGTRIRSLVRFAIFQSEGGPVPDGAAIVSASLNLYKYGYYDTKYQLKPMLVEWSETAATWNQRTAGAPWAVAGALGQGSDAAAAADAQADAGWDPGWVVFDITGGVQAIAAGSRSNLGWVLDTLSGNGNVKRFYSSEYAANPALRPKLVLRYQ
ncbi:MAG TPA: Ig-like domain-containing protein [Rubrivivax sp.]|nr:Ig-like domain-containing protein [Rubrivivax sp.]